MIEVKDLAKIYHIDGHEFRAVDNVSLAIGKGEIVSIAGHSGSGKTTLLSLIGGLTKPDSGSVVIAGQDIWTMDDARLAAFRNKRISFIYQFSSLIPTLNALENVMLPTTFGDHPGDIEKNARELLEIVGLKERMHSYPSHLSGGQQRRVAIARAFINEPEIILADEPTGDLDEETEAEMMNLFKKMNRERGVLFLLVTHSSELAMQAERRLRMQDGRLLENRA